MLALNDLQQNNPPKIKSNEWFTPAKYIEAAREVMGSIDLDPASCGLANQTVRAERYYTIEDDGLAQEWHGNVWLNPPFGHKALRDNKGYLQSNRQTFVLKLLQEYEQGNVSQAILLSGAMTDAKWFRPFWQFSICFADHKIRFIRPGDPNNNAQLWSMVFIYLGSHEQKFITTFSQFGRIARAIDAPRKEVAPIQLWEVK